MSKKSSRTQVNKIFEARSKISALLPTPLPFKVQKSKALFECENGQTEGFILTRDNQEVGFMIPFLGKKNQAYLMPDNKFINKQSMIIESSFISRKDALLLIEPQGFYVNIEIDGVAQTYRLFCTESDYTPGVVATGDTSITLIYNSVTGTGNRLATSSNGQDRNWAFLPVFNKTLEWTIDFSNQPCGLNNSFYSAIQTIGSDYGDGCITNPPAAEFDFMEGNRSVWHTTLHLKDNDCGTAPSIGYGGTINQLPPSEIPKYAFKNEDGTTDNTYGYGSEFTINTEYPFQAKIEQNVNSENVLESITLTLSQGDKKVTAGFDSSNEEFPGKLKKFGEELNDVSDTTGNVIFWSLWGKAQTGADLDWLETPPCEPGSTVEPSPDIYFVFSDFCIS